MIHVQARSHKTSVLGSNFGEAIKGWRRKREDDTIRARRQRRSVKMERRQLCHKQQ